MKLSIITINYNNATGLEKTIQSVINQTFTDYEYIIIDGGSTDGSLDVIKKYADHITTWVSEPDKGVYNAMNKGIKIAKGEFINFMNSGDTFYETNTLSNVQNYLTCDIIAGRWQKDHHIVYQSINNEVSMLDLFTDALNHQATFIKRTLFENNLYNEKYSIISDWIFTVETIVFKNCTYKCIEEIIVDYDGHGISSDTNNRLKERENYLKEKLPQRIHNDYINFVLYKKSPLYSTIPQLSKCKYSFQVFISKIDYSLIYLYNLFVRTFKRF
jgi:glycosyltransferase involved in cell wall biosynthesis